MKISVIHALCVASLAACSAKVSTPLPETLRVQVASEPGHLDPYLAETGAEMMIIRHLVRTPLRYDSQGAWVGDAAESYAWESDGKFLKLVFKEGLKWSDSSPLSACDYRRGIFRMLGKDTGQPSPFSDLYRGVRGYSSALHGNFSELEKSVLCEGRELRIEMDIKYNRFALDGLAFLGTAPWREGLGSSHRVTSGEFYVSEWRKGRSIKVSAIDRKRFLAPNFEFLFIRDADTALIMYDKNDLEVLSDLPTTLLPKLRARQDFRRTSMLATYYIAFSVRPENWTSDVRLRRALALSAGREEFPALLQSGERAAYTLSPDELLDSTLLAEFRSRNKEDPVEARRLWAIAGAKAPQKISLGYSAGSRHQLLMERLANNWKRHLGVEVVFEPQEWNHYVDTLKSKPADVFRYAWTALYPDPRFFLGLFSSDSPQNFGRWKAKSYDEYVKKLETLPREGSEFLETVLRAEQVLVAGEVAMIPLYHYSKVFMARGEVGRKLEFTFQGFVDLTSLTKTQ